MNREKSYDPGRVITPSQGRTEFAAAVTRQLPLFVIVTDGEPLTWQAPARSMAELPEVIRDRGVTIDPLSGCFRVGGPHDRDGYAKIGGETAHRIAWRELVGPIPDGLVLDHVARRGCRWRDCVLIDHLEPVTSRENTLRGCSFAAVNAAKTECDHGHPFDETNTYRWRGRRDCRACGRRRVAEYKGRQRADLARAA